MDKNEDERSASSNSNNINYLTTSSINNNFQNTKFKHPLQRPSHQRTRSVDLKLTYSSSPHNHHSSNSSSSSTLINSSSTSSSINNKQSQLLFTIEEKVAKLYYKHGLFCSRHPSWLILLSLIIVTIISYQIITFHGIFGSSYDVYISSSSSIIQESSSFLKSDSNSPQSSSDSTHPLMKHFDIWPDSYVRNELDNDQNIPPWFQQNLSYAYVQQIFIRSAIIPWNDDMQLVDAIRAPFELIFDLIESISNFQYKNDLNNDFGDWITMNDVCFQVFEPTLSKRYQHISKHLPSYSCLLLSPANIWNGDRIRFQQDSNLLTTLLKFQDIQSSPVPSGIMHDLLFGVAFDETGIRRTYGRNRQRTITYSITLILRKNIPEFIDSLRTFLYKRYPISMMNKNLKINNNKAESSSSTSSTTSSMVINNLVHNNESEDDQDCSIDNKTKHIYFHNTFTYNYLLPLVLIYTAVCLYMNFSVRKIEIIRNKWLYSLLTLMTILMSLFMSFGICFRLRFHSVLIVNRLLPYFVAGISFENMLVLTKSVLANPHLDSKVRVAQALSREGLSITKNLLTELTLLSIGSFTFMPFFQECCKIAAVCFLSDFFIQITFFTPFLSSLIQRINEQSIISNNKYSSAYLDKHYLTSSYPRNIYARPGEPVQQKTPKRLRFIYFLAQLRLVQRCFILLLSACIGLAIYNAYLVLEQSNNTFEQNINHQQFIENRSENLNNKEEIPKTVETISPLKESNSTKTNSKPKQQLKNDLPEMFDVSNKLKSFMKLLGNTNINRKDDQISPSPTSSSSPQSLSPEMSTITNPYYRILYDVDDNPMPKPFANHHWTNLFSLYNISLVGRFISILPPILLSIPISPEKAKQLRNDGDTDYYTLKRFIPMKFTNGEYVISDDDDFDKFDQPKRLYWSKDDLHLIIGLWLPCLLIFIYLIYQLYRCICTRNYAEWRSQLSSTNPLARLASFIKRTALNDNTIGNNGVGGGKQEKLIRIDITLLNYDREKESYLDEKQFLLNNQDIELICTNMNTSLVATSSLSGDIRCYDALTCESLATIKRSQNLGDFSIYKKTKKIPKRNNNEPLNDNEINQNSIVVKTEGNILRTLFYRINNDDDDYNNNDDDANVEERKSANTESSKTNEEQQPKLMFRPIWCMDIYDRYILVGCGSDDGRFEVWDAYTSRLVFVYHPESPVMTTEMNEKQQKYSYGITAIKSTYWGVALARINGQMEMLELEQLKEDKYLMKLFQPNSSSSSSSIRTNCQNTNNNTELSYRCKCRIQAHKQPITRIEIIDSLEDEEFIKVFGSRGCLITGSMDTTLKVFALDNFKLMYTLNGHCGSIVSTCIDPYSTASALSGCQLGQLCVWDLNTGTCIFSMQAHSDAEVLCITTSPLYYVTSGTDNNICIWDRYSGHLIHTIHNQHTICKNMIFLEPYILMTVRDSELIIWDVNDARSLCLVPLANHYNNQMIMDNQSQQQQQQLNKWNKSYQTMMIKNLLFSYQRKALICDYGNSICIINNPFETKKLD